MGKSKSTADSTGYYFTKYITLRNGRRIYASSYGLKAFRIKAR